MKVRFFTHWNKIDEAEKKKGFENEDKYKEAVKEVEEIGKFKDQSALEKLNEEFLKTNGNSMEHTHEYIKLRGKLFGDKDHGKFEKLATNALEKDLKKEGKVIVAVKMHKRLIKAGSNGEQFKKQGQKDFKYSPYFQEAKA